MKLTAKYAATILLLVFFIVLAFASVILVQFRSEISRLNARSAETLRQSVLKEMQEKEALSLRVMASALTDPLYQLDMLKIAELVSAVGEATDVLYIYVYDNKRRIIHDGTRNLETYNKILGDPLTVESMRSRRVVTKVEGDTFHIAAPIRIQNETLGGVKVGFSTKKIFADIAKQGQEIWPTLPCGSDQPVAHDYSPRCRILRRRADYCGAGGTQLEQANHLTFGTDLARRSRRLQRGDSGSAKR